nr:hypothetical protein CFP56_72333 [Quercus suber]
MTPATTAGMPLIPSEQAANATGAFSATAATLEICNTIQDVLGTLNNGDLRIATAQRKCEVLTSYGQMLKQKQPNLRATQHLLATTAGRASVVGNVHASCTYYHALILVTRPSLIASLTTRLSPRPSPTTSSTSTSDGSVQNLSEICIDSAIHMAQTCYDAFTAGILLANMCLLKVWLFEAGLVLGFAMSVDATGHSDAEDAYRNARKVLKTLSKTSSLAKEYYDILSSLLQAINMYRRQKAKQGHPQSRHSVGRLLEFDISRPSSRLLDPTGIASALGSPEEPIYGHSTNDFMITGDDFDGGNINSEFDYGSEQWLQFANQVSGFLPMNNDSLGSFFNIQAAVLSLSFTDHRASPMHWAVWVFFAGPSRGMKWRETRSLDGDCVLASTGASPRGHPPVSSHAPRLPGMFLSWAMARHSVHRILEKTRPSDPPSFDASDATTRKTALSEYPMLKERVHEYPVENQVICALRMRSRKDEEAVICSNQFIECSASMVPGPTRKKA